MKDRFKSRAWDKNNKKMLYHFLIDVYTGEFLCIKDPEITGIDPILDDIKKDSFVDSFNVFDIIPMKEDVVLMQCIGLRDWKGKLIYEGDIVKAKSNNKKGYLLWEVIFFEINASFIFASFDRSNDCTIDSAHFCYGKDEIIGNIFENPELINNN